jgi:hypothetical protein
VNKALALFNTAMVTPTYYASRRDVLVANSTPPAHGGSKQVIFTFLTLVTSAILNQGFKAPVTDLITIILGSVKKKGPLLGMRS